MFVGRRSVLTMWCWRRQPCLRFVPLLPPWQVVGYTGVADRDAKEACDRQHGHQQGSQAELKPSGQG